MSEAEINQSAIDEGYCGCNIVCFDKHGRQTYLEFGNDDLSFRDCTQGAPLSCFVHPLFNQEHCAAFQRLQKEMESIPVIEPEQPRDL